MGRWAICRISQACLAARTIFVDDQLVRGKYAFSETHSNDNHHITDYMALRKLLTEKYGLPVARDARDADQLWLNDLYRDDADSWGTAVSAGQLVYLSEWHQDDTLITLCLSGDNYEVQLAIEYIGKAYERLEEQMKQQKHLGEL
jgi:hypothetical protein